MPAQENSERAGEKPPAEPPKPAAPSKEYLVERLTHHDINDICALYRRVWDGLRTGLPQELVKAWSPTPLEFSSWMEGVTYFAARQNGRLVGAVGCRITEGNLQLMQLAVDTDHRRHGVGTALTNAAVDWAKRNNCHSLWVDALTQFTAAAEMLKRLGFVESGILHRHYFAEDVRLLEKVL